MKKDDIPEIDIDGLSANLRSCNNLEQFCLTNSAELWSFHMAWILALFANPKPE